MIDIEAYTQTQVVAESVNPLLFEGIQVLCSLRIVITSSILKKNRRHHPEMDKLYSLLAEVCTDPDYVCYDNRDSEVAISYKTVGHTRLRVALWLKQAESPAEFHNSVLSYRLFHEKELSAEIEQGRVVYRRGKT